MDAGASRLMTSGTIGSGCGAADARRARRPSPCCPLGRRHTATTATPAVSRRGTPPWKANRRRTAGTPRDCRMFDDPALGVAQIRQPLDLHYKSLPGGGRFVRRAYHPCLELSSRGSYSASGGKLPMSAHATAQLVKQQISLLNYLLSQAWRPTRRIARGRLMGLCPLHGDRNRSGSRSEACSTAMAAAAAAMSSVLSSCLTACPGDVSAQAERR
jgi:hypothetical protein